MTSNSLLLSTLVEIIVLQVFEKHRYVISTRGFMEPPDVGEWVVESSHIVRRGNIKAIGKVLESNRDFVTLELLNGKIQKWVNARFDVIPMATGTLDEYREKLALEREKRNASR